MNIYPHIDRDKPLMVVVDTSVFLHKLDQSITFDHLTGEFTSAIKANLVWLMSGEWLGDLKPLLGRMVFVMDTKDGNGCYWRTEYLRDLNNVLDIVPPTRARSEHGKQVATEKAQEKAKVIREALDAEQPSEEQLATIDAARAAYPIQYKAGRKLPNYRFKKIRTLVYRYLDELKADTLSAMRYEADDMAASLVKTNTRLGNDWSILLLTVDSDWLGMLNPSVTWVCMTGYSPVVRDTLEVVNTWAEKRLGTELETWRDIWDVKSYQGDASDNLPPSQGKLLPVIDLLNPPEQYKFWLKEPAVLQSYFTVNTKMRFDGVAAKDAKDFLRLAGQTPVVRFLPYCTPELRGEKVTLPESTDELRKKDMLTT